MALALGALLTPLALMAYVLGFWRLAADLGFVGQFAISDPVFSHWQVWIPVAVVLHIATVSINGYGRGGDLRVPRALVILMPSFRHAHRRRKSQKIIVR